MKRHIFVVVIVWCLVSAAVEAGEITKAEAAVDRVLSSLHQAASDADGDLYFSLFADDAVFLGTDASERWSVGELEAFAQPYFSNGRGWTYSAKERHISVAADGETAWFDEVLWNDTYGTCRGTGVLVLVEGVWKISQYNLTIPIPNALAAGFAEKIREHENREPDQD